MRRESAALGISKILIEWMDFPRKPNPADNDVMRDFGIEAKQKGSNKAVQCHARTALVAIDVSTFREAIVLISLCQFSRE